jgi:hypothetical protein
MKPFYFMILTFGVSLVSCGQDIPASKVPSVVVNTVQIKFPVADNIEWEKKKNYYEAEFMIDSSEHTVYIDATGKLLQHKKEIPTGSLPELIQKAVLSAHPGYLIDDVSLVDENGEISYEVELEAKGKKDKTVIFSITGEPIINK